MSEINTESRFFIKFWRELAGRDGQPLSQSQLARMYAESYTDAERLFPPSATLTILNRIKNIESGRTKPKPEFLERIAEILNVPTEARTQAALDDWMVSNLMEAGNLTELEALQTIQRRLADSKGGSPSNTVSGNSKAGRRGEIQVIEELEKMPGQISMSFQKFTNPVFNATLLFKEISSGNSVIGHLKIKDGELHVKALGHKAPVPLTLLTMTGILVSYTVESQMGLLLPSEISSV
ncbi:MAG: XRE family transcriptional regulator [Alphaproteobacteria bacterium]|nr:MAG: XRE family transcriptional regulator [Alphaproteobacteria bacterium]